MRLSERVQTWRDEGCLFSDIEIVINKNRSIPDVAQKWLIRIPFCLDFQGATNFIIIFFCKSIAESKTVIRIKNTLTGKQILPNKIVTAFCFSVFCFLAERDCWSKNSCERFYALYNNSQRWPLYTSCKESFDITDF